MAIQQMISLRELLVNRALDNYAQPEAPRHRIVARGLVGTPHRPVRLRSSRKSSNRGVSNETRLQILGPLRNPAGASPLTTRSV
ncbi:hypothetical protein [Pseudomonas fluorescens]|uniref:hypothetical protein n=1 Tax=Pseudomonas fluorescens TaxID=294 RepID=UPI0011470B54